MDAWHFPIMILVSLAVFVVVLLVALRQRNDSPSALRVAWVSGVVVPGGMLFARAGAMAGLPAWLYYGVPAALIWVLPPIAFRMRGRDLLRYFPMAALCAPVLHLMFSLILGWHEYMPFIPLPSLRDLLIDGAV
jgi:hypothetical protein